MAWKHRILDIDYVTNKVYCEHCGLVKATIKDGKYKCSVARKEQRGPNNGGYVKRPHGLTSSEARALCAEAGRCAICETTSNLVVDHDHKSLVIRGVLCHTCNVGLGMFKDSQRLLLEAVKYLGEN